jgi:ribosome-associated translation inhibitor RaiA
MLIQINSDSNIEGDNALAQRVEAVMRDALDRFSEQITRVEVHLGDENSGKKFGTDDKRCLLEARLVGLQPIAVSHQAATLEQAIDGAVKQLKRSLDSTLGRLGKR